MGWIMRRDAQGQGYAARSVPRRARLVRFDLQRRHSIPAIIDAENAPSIRLAERLGFERLAEVNYRDEPNAFFRRPART